jgi:hypothetical protein
VWKHQEDNWIKEIVEIRNFKFVMIAIVTFQLVFIPSLLAFIVSYSTPRVS